MVRHKQSSNPAKELADLMRELKLPGTDPMVRVADYHGHKGKRIAVQAHGNKNWYTLDSTHRLDYQPLAKILVPMLRGYDLEKLEVFLGTMFVAKRPGRRLFA